MWFKMRSLSSIILEKNVRWFVKQMIKDTPESEILIRINCLEEMGITFESSLERAFKNYPDLEIPVFNDNYSNSVLKLHLMLAKGDISCCIDSDRYGRRINFGTKEEREFYSDIWACEVNASRTKRNKKENLHRLHNKARAYEYIKNHPMEFSETLVMYASGTLKSNEKKIPGRIMFNLEAVEDVV